MPSIQAQRHTHTNKSKTHNGKRREWQRLCFTVDQVPEGRAQSISYIATCLVLVHTMCADKL